MPTPKAAQSVPDNIRIEFPPVLPKPLRDAVIAADYFAPTLDYDSLRKLYPGCTKCKLAGATLCTLHNDYLQDVHYNMSWGEIFKRVDDELFETTEYVAPNNAVGYILSPEDYAARRKKLTERLRQWIRLLTMYFAMDRQMPTWMNKLLTESRAITVIGHRTRKDLRSIIESCNAGGRDFEKQNNEDAKAANVHELEDILSAVDNVTWFQLISWLSHIPVTGESNEGGCIPLDAYPGPQLQPLQPLNDPTLLAANPHINRDRPRPQEFYRTQTVSGHHVEARDALVPFLYFGILDACENELRLRLICAREKKSRVNLETLNQAEPLRLLMSAFFASKKILYDIIWPGAYSSKLIVPWYEVYAICSVRLEYYFGKIFSSEAPADSASGRPLGAHGTGLM